MNSRGSRYLTLRLFTPVMFVLAGSFRDVGPLSSNIPYVAVAWHQSPQARDEQVSLTGQSKVHFHPWG